MNYVNNAELLAEVRSYFDTGVRSEALGEMILLIATRYAEKGSFSGYSYKDDMICEAILTCIKYMHNFKVDKEGANPFAYFSKVVHNAFLNYIAKQKKHSNIKDVCYKNIDSLVDDQCMIESEAQYFNITGIDYQIIRGKKKKKKRRRKKKVIGTRDDKAV